MYISHYINMFVMTDGPEIRYCNKTESSVIITMSTNLLYLIVS